MPYFVFINFLKKIYKYKSSLWMKPELDQTTKQNKGGKTRQKKKKIAKT